MDPTIWPVVGWTNSTLDYLNITLYPYKYDWTLFSCLLWMTNYRTALFFQPSLSQLSTIFYYTLHDVLWMVFNKRTYLVSRYSRQHTHHQVILIIDHNISHFYYLWIIFLLVIAYQLWNTSLFHKLILLLNLHDTITLVIDQPFHLFQLFLLQLYNLLFLFHYLFIMSNNLLLIDTLVQHTISLGRFHYFYIQWSIICLLFVLLLIIFLFL